MLQTCLLSSVAIPILAGSICRHGAGQGLHHLSSLITFQQGAPDIVAPATRSFQEFMVLPFGLAQLGCNMTWPDCRSRTINKKAPSMCQVICINLLHQLATYEIDLMRYLRYLMCMASRTESAYGLHPTRHPLHGWHRPHLDLQLCLGEAATCQGTPLLALLQHLVLMQLHSLFLPGEEKLAQGTSRDSNPSEIYPLSHLLVCILG